MHSVNLKVALATFALGALALTAAVSMEVRAQTPSVDPVATQILHRMTDYLGNLRQFSVHTDNTLEEVLESGQKIQHDMSANVMIQRPNKLRAERNDGLIRQTFFYDGKTLTIWNPEDNYYAVAVAPPTIEAMLHFARDSLDIVPPSGDLVYENAYDLLTETVTSGFVVGKSIVGGVKCDQLAFSGPIVDWQIWIAEGDKPLPHKYVITTKDDPVYPQYVVLMSDWNVAPDLNDTLFGFEPPHDAKETEFILMDTAETSIR